MIKTRGDKWIDIVNYSLISIILFIMIYPLYFTIIASISEPSEVVMGKVFLLPKGFMLDAYTNVFRTKEVWIGYRNTFIYASAGTLLNLVLTLTCAYVLSKRRLQGHFLLSWFFLFTMFFGGGLIPTYLIVKSIGLLNKAYTLIILNGFSVFYMVIARIYFQTSIPEEIYESARIDGCSNFGQFFKIALPLSKTIIAVLALFYAVVRWNDYFTALIYISSTRYYPLQLVLRNILIEGQTALASLQLSPRQVLEEEMLSITRQQYMAEAMKYALIFIASAPLLVAYPFVQKYFVKGVMIGSLKG